MQGIEFQIINDSDEAAKGLERLERALSNLKINVKEGASSLSQIGNGISKLRQSLKDIDPTGIGDKLKSLSTAVNNLKIDRSATISSSLPKNITALNKAALAADPAKITSIGTSLQTIADVGNSAKISAALPKNLEDLSVALSYIDPSAASILRDIGDGLKPLSELGTAHLTSYINQLGKFPKLIEDLGKLDIAKFSDEMRDLADAMKPFADEMAKVSSGFAAFPSRIQRLITSTEQYNGTVKRATSNTNSFGSALKKVSIAVIIKKVGSLIGKAMEKASQYQEVLNLFTVSMGEYAKEAYEYAQTVSDAMGIDPAEWMENQGVFNTIITGFGVAGDKAAYMSKNLTQLSYDLASFYNIGFTEAMQKVQSGIAGELEPMRRLGYDLSVARLEQERLNLGIEKSVSDMTQAEKSQLRYYAMMTQVTQVQGDMARTLNQPVNMLRILRAELEQTARAFGNIFIPILTNVLPWLIAVAQGIREIVVELARLFNIEIGEVDWGSSFSTAAGATGEIEDNMSGAAGAAKDLKRYLAGFDELNVLPDKTSGGSGGGVSAGGGGLDIPLLGYDFLGEEINKKVSAIKEKLEPVISWIKNNLEGIRNTVVAIGAAFLAWKLATSIVSGVGKIAGFLKSLSASASVLSGLSGITFIADLAEFMRYFNDFSANGASFSNITGMFSELIGMAGSIAAMSGNLKVGGALKFIQGIGELVIASESIKADGWNVENTTTAIRGLGNVVIAVGLIQGDLTTVGTGMAMAGLSTVIREVADNWEAIKEGDWSGVDKVQLAIGAVEMIAGFVTVLIKLNNIKSSIPDITATQETMSSVGGAAEALNTGTSALTSKLKDLVVNIGLGVAIIAEVSAAAIIFIGAIAILGWELDKVREAWQPVIDNAGTVAISVGIGTGILVGVGAICYALGTVGKGIALNVGIGTAILVELGVAAAVFIAEIWGIGKGLDEIGKAWEPVLNNGEDIAISIGIGTGLLVGIGVVTAALGAATVGTAGLIPIAVGLGTALLVELAAAFVLFCDSLVDVADELTDELAPAFDRLNPKIPGLIDDTDDFIKLMSELAGDISSYNDSMAKMSWDSIVDKFRSFFVKSPIKTFASSVKTISDDTSDLNKKLQKANDELTSAVSLLGNYTALMDKMRELSSGSQNIDLPDGIYTNLKAAGSKLVTGWADGMKDKKSYLKSTLSDIASSVFDSDTAYSTGYSFGQSLANGISQAIKNATYPSLKGTMSTSGGTARMSFSAYASGGFPDPGQFFLARENGVPEMVGSIGRRTAVANNDQIVEALKTGVYEAVVAATGGGNNQNGGQAQVVSANVNGKNLFEFVVDYARGETVRTGANPLLEF